MFSRDLAWLGVATGAVGIVAERLRPLLGWAYTAYGLALWKVGANAADAQAQRRAAGDRQPAPA